MARSEPALDSHERYRLLVEHSPHCIHQIDLDGRLCSMNPAGLLMMGASCFSDIEGVAYCDGVCERDQPRIRDLLQRAYAGETSRFTFESPSGQHYSSNFVPLFDTSGAVFGLMGISEDITARVLAERRLRQVQKLEGLGLLAGGIAHDFNNLLAGIMGNAELLALQHPADDDTPIVNAVLQATTHAANLSRELLAYAGQTTLSSRVIDLRDVVRETSELMASSMPSGVGIEFENAGLSVWVDADPTQIRQVVMNLLTNASDATAKRGGSVTVRIGQWLDPEPEETRTWTVGQSPLGPAALIEVADDGDGMDIETIERMFDPFFTTRATGHGLGLAAVVGIVTSHKGGIRVRSSPGQGTTVQVVLPAAAPSAITAESPVALAVPILYPVEVCVVDDQAVVREATARVARRHAATVLEFAGGPAFLDWLAGGGRPELVLLDLTMPLVPGSAVLEALTDRGLKFPVLLMSGYSADGVDAVNHPNVIGFLQKPFRIADFDQLVAEALAARVSGQP